VAASLVDVHDDEGGEIVVRDQHGEIELADPPSPEVDELDEGALDDRQENEREFRGSAKFGARLQRQARDNDLQRR
jgi:hypothetical protein